MTALEAEVRNVVFASEQSSFSVLKVLLPGGDVETVVGPLSGVKPGEILKMKGDWRQDAKFGRQFRVQKFIIQTPATKGGIMRYLSSGVLPGVGEKTAERIVEFFGDETLFVLENEPQRLREISGIGKKKVEGIIVSVSEKLAFNETLAYLQSLEIPTGTACRIYKCFKEDTISVLKKNPYRLAWDVRGIGFKKADEIALNMGIDKVGVIRMAAVSMHALSLAGDQGHSFLPLERVIADASKLVAVDEHYIGEGIRLAIKEGLVVLTEVTWLNKKQVKWRGPALYLKSLYDAEVRAAKELARIIHSPNKFDHQRALEHLENVLKESSIDVAKKQYEGLRSMLTSKVSVLTGGPGTGKTTLIRLLLAVLRKMHESVALAAPTGRAAKRLCESTSESAKTLHRLLEYKPGEARQFQRHEENLLPQKWIIVDETSMVDIHMIGHLLRAIQDGSHVVFVGDDDQLPSVGCGNVLEDMMKSRELEVTKLTEIFRQAQGSLITQNAHCIRRGIFPKLEAVEDETVEARDFFFVNADDESQIVSRLVDLCQRQIPEKYQIDATQDIQVITPMHRGSLGSKALNQILQRALNRGRKPTDALEMGQKRFLKGDRVMQIRNNYNKNVFNGDIGRIKSIRHGTSELEVAFDSENVFYKFSELDEIELAYAITVHKSQGSEYPIVVSPLTPAHFIMLQRNLIYTALTRAKMLCVWVGSPKAVGMAIGNHESGLRYSFLADRIKISCGEVAKS